MPPHRVRGMSALAAAALGWLLAAPIGAAAEFEFRLAHYLPPTHNHAQNILPAWIERVSAASGGRIDIELYPAGQLLGIAEIYDGVRNGVADLGWGLPAAQPGRFPRLSLLELPFLFASAEEATHAAMTLQQDGVFDEEFGDVILLYLHTHAPAGIHTRTDPIVNVTDFDGQRIRFASATVRDLLAAFGAEPVGVPAPQVYENLENSVLDGVAFPYEAMKGLRLGEQVDYHSDVPLYVLPFYLVMNRQAFDSLPPDLQEVMLDSSGMDEALRVAASWDEEEGRGRAYVRALGNDIVTPTADQLAAWQARADGVVEARLALLEAEGITDARALYARLAGR